MGNRKGDDIINPVFKEYIQFLKDKSVDYPLEEGFYWLDNQIIKAYDKQGNLHKIIRLKIDDNLNISFKEYKQEKFEIESWQETIERNKDRLNELEMNSIKMINDSLLKYKDYEPIILTSGGKDSSVVMNLVRTIKDVKAIFNNTSLDCADTYLHIKTLDNIQITNPIEGFYKWIKTNIIPTRFSRGCCRVFKEIETTKIFKDNNTLFFMGIRNKESNTRSQYQDEIFNPNWGNKPYIGILPIREWTELDVWLYILKNNIPINNKYKKGYARVGCAIACPYYAKSTWVLDKYWYPKMYERWHNILEKDFIDNYKWTRMNCTLEEYHLNWNGGLVRSEPTKEVIKEFAEYKGLDYEVAKKYFNHECKICNKKVNKKDEIAMNMKFLGRNIEEYYCKKHLIELLKIDKMQWNKYIEEFKQQGCSLF